MGNGLTALLAGPAKLAADADVDRAALVSIDVPAASGALEAAGPSVFENAGIELDLVMIPPDTPNMTPNIAAELENDPGQIQVAGDPNFCAKAMDAIAAAGSIRPAEDPVEAGQASCTSPAGSRWARSWG